MDEETYRRTLKIPVHYATTGKKLSILRNLTARLTHAVRTINRRVRENVENGGESPETRGDIRRHSQDIGELTGLSAGFVQQCEDKVLWAWRQYQKVHRKWRYLMSKAGNGTKWKKKLKRREPSHPFTSKRSRLGKIPVRIDRRTGELQKADLKLTSWVAHISTLKKGQIIDVLLNPSDWHKKQLEEADEIKSFEIVRHKNRDRFMVHVTCEYQAPRSPRRGITGADLGVKRPISAVLIGREGFQGFNTLRSEKQEKIQKLNDRVSHLQRLEKWEVLKKLRHKRRRVAEYHDRMLAKRFAEETRRYLAIVGNPAYIRYYNYRGNNNRTGRKILQNWSFGRQVKMIEHEKGKTGHKTVVLNEWGTSSGCWKCSSKIERPVDGNYQRARCPDCGEYDADFIGGMNIAKLGISLLCEKSSEPFWQDLAGAIDDVAQNGR